MTARFAICPVCKHAFITSLSDGRVFCERCGHDALVSDGAPANVFKIFNEAFPTATTKKTKREVWRLAERVAAREITAREALEMVSPEGDASLRDNTLFWMTAMMLIIAIIQAFQNVDEEHEARRDHAELMGVLGQIQSTLAATVQTDAEPNPKRAPENSPLALRGRTGDASKPRKRATKRRRKKSAS